MRTQCAYEILLYGWVVAVWGRITKGISYCLKYTHEGSKNGFRLKHEKKKKNDKNIYESSGGQLLRIICKFIGIWRDILPLKILCLAVI